MIKRYFQYRNGSYFTAAFETQEEADAYSIPDDAVELSEAPEIPDDDPSPMSATDKLVQFLNANSDVKALLGF